MKAGNFREDLYYRLNVFPIIIPPLRERIEDVPLLVNHFIQKYAPRIGKKISGVSKGVLEDLSAYHWPGNVRELENIIERAIVISPPEKLVLGDWFSKSDERPIDQKTPTLEELEKRHILMVLEKTDWRVSGKYGAAQILGLKRTTLEARMQKLGIFRNKQI